MPKEGRFYVEYLGWKETRGLHGSDYTDPIAIKLLGKRKSSRKLHRMTIKVTRDELQITQHVTGPNGKSQKIRYPAQQMCDVSYVSQCSPPHSHVVGCIFLGYNSKTNCAAHVHAYIFDSSDTATVFVKLLNSIIEQSEYRQRILAMERDLFQLGHINARTSQHEYSGHDTMGSDGASYGSHSPNSSDSGLPRSYPTADEALRARKDIVIKRTPSQRKPEPVKMFNNVQDELAHKLELQQQKEMPILLPPKDYDTIVRRYGHLSIRAKVKQRSVIGADGVFGASFVSKTTKPADGNNNPSEGKPRRADGYVLQKSESSSSAGDQDIADEASSHSSTEDDTNMYGLYKGLKQDDGYNSIQEDMAMWSPEFSFGTRSASTESSGFNSDKSGLRRVKVTATQKY